MKKISITLVIIGVLLIFVVPSFSGQVGNSSVGQWYLYPDQDGGTIMYPDGVAKLKFNWETGDYELKGHGLLAGMLFEVRSGGNSGDEGGLAVGSGKSRLGNNVLIKGNIYDYGYSCSDLGDYWNLWVDTTGEGNWVRVLRSPADDPPVCY